MRLARLRAPALVLLLSLSACANIWGFDDLRSDEDGGGPEDDATAPPEPDATADVAVDHSIDSPSTRDVDHPDTDVRDARPDVDSSVVEAGHDADSSAPDADADVTVPDTGSHDSAPDVKDTSPPGPDANDATMPEASLLDTSVPDTSVMDTSVVDTSVPDTSIVDTGLDVTSLDTGLPSGTDLTAAGTIVALVPTSMGPGSTNIEVIRDGVFPAVNSTDASKEYDTFNGMQRTEDWIGYTYATAQTFGTVVFQGGTQYDDGGWFMTVGIQVEVAGVWTTVTSTCKPTYAGNDLVNFETYTFTLTPPVAGTGIRIDGMPGGSDTYISVAELRVYAP